MPRKTEDTFGQRQTEPSCKTKLHQDHIVIVLAAKSLWSFGKCNECKQNAHSQHQRGAVWHSGKIWFNSNMAKLNK